MVRVLAQDDDLHFGKGRELECLENLAAGRVDDLSGCLFFVEEADEGGEIRFFEFVPQGLFPGLFYLYVH